MFRHKSIGIARHPVTIIAPYSVKASQTPYTLSKYSQADLVSRGKIEQVPLRFKVAKYLLSRGEVRGLGNKNEYIEMVDTDGVEAASPEVASPEVASPEVKDESMAPATSTAEVEVKDESMAPATSIDSASDIVARWLEDVESVSDEDIDAAVNVFEEVSEISDVSPGVLSQAAAELKKLLDEHREKISSQPAPTRAKRDQPSKWQKVKRLKTVHETLKRKLMTVRKEGGVRKKQRGGRLEIQKKKKGGSESSYSPSSATGSSYSPSSATGSSYSPSSEEEKVAERSSMRLRRRR
jgi:hypothetical protein